MENFVTLYGFRTLEDIHLDKKEWVDNIPLNDFLSSDLDNYKEEYKSTYFTIISVNDNLWKFSKYLKSGKNNIEILDTGKGWEATFTGKKNDGTMVYMDCLSNVLGNTDKERTENALIHWKVVESETNITILYEGFYEEL